MGLTTPAQGVVKVDGRSLTDEASLAYWQNQIAHVPQSIYLSDASMTENIAFGVPIEDIDSERVALVCQQTKLDDFVKSLPHGYQTVVGERGVRLSGGQRQRIAIARALYREASVLIFDEATSALDSDTEAGVIEAIEKLNLELTIIMVAHRVTTLAICDKVVRLEGGRIVSQGSYQEVVTE